MLEIKNIEKSYHSKKALSNISLTLENGIYGLLGPNGAGKSTLMNIITDNILPDKGEVLWDGNNTVRMGKAFRRILGYTPQQQGLYDDFTGKRFLSYIGALKEIPGGKLPSEIERTASLVNLADQLDKKLGAYSGGMKQRILIAQALMGDPKLIIMDEPTAGLDPKERVRIRHMVSALAEDRILLIATHVVSDIQSISSEIIMLKSGRLIAKGAPSELIRQYAEGGSLEDAYMYLFGEEDMPCV